MSLMLIFLVITLFLLLIRDRENIIILEILDLVRLFFNHTFELLRLFVLRVNSVEITGHFNVTFSKTE